MGRLLGEVVQKYPIDPARIVMGGQEGGGTLAFMAAFRNREVILRGRRRRRGAQRTAAGKRTALSAGDLRSQREQIAHAAADRSVVGLRCGR